MFKPELWQSHSEYRTIVTKIGRRLSRNNPKYSFDSYEEERAGRYIKISRNEGISLFSK